MYIPGFLLIFAGLALILYYFVLRFAGVPDSSAAEPVVTAKSETDLSTEAMKPDPSAPQSDSPIVMDSVKAGSPEKEPVQKYSAPSAPQPDNRTVMDSSSEKRLYATGYLYTDTAGRIDLLDHPEQMDGELTASLKRLGPATLRFRRSSYYFDHADGLLVIPENRLREIRFSDGGAVFVPGGSDLPLVYFFTVDTQTIREFLSSRS
jgi:hypothetical protein